MGVKTRNNYNYDDYKGTEYHVRVNSLSMRTFDTYNEACGYALRLIRTTTFNEEDLQIVRETIDRQEVPIV